MNEKMREELISYLIRMPFCYTASIQELEHVSLLGSIKDPGRQAWGGGWGRQWGKA